jgi:autotransporter translocation and assembly factor TamB
MASSRLRKIARVLARSVVAVVAAVLVLLGIALTLVETNWGKDRLRQLIVSQTARFLNGTLEIDSLDGSLLRGIHLRGVRLTEGGQPIIAIDDVSVAYSIRDLYTDGTAIRRLALGHLRVVGRKNPDGRWNLGSLVHRNSPPRPDEPSKPGRRITFESIELTDASVELIDPLTFGAAHVPSRFEDLNATFSFELQLPAWRLDFTNASFTGLAPDLQVTHLAGGVGTGRPGWNFEHLRVETPRSAFTLDGSVHRDPPPTILALSVDAERFAFQEWSGILTGLKNIAVESSFSTKLSGPTERLATELNLQSNGGNIHGAFVLNSDVPGWHGAGTVQVATFDLARWLNRIDRPSNITGTVEFDLDLDLGRHFPRGAYRFKGAHAAYMGYEADDVVARGQLTPTETVLAQVTATAYGANVRVDSGAIGLDAPFPYRFAGRADGVDLRRLPPEVPIPHVESTLVLGYDVHGQFSDGFIIGRADFDDSRFLDADIRAGTRGTIDTSSPPFRYSGEGDIGDISLRRFGAGLGVEWMQDPRYSGTIAGHFRVEGAGADSATMTLTGGGRLTRADLFGGTLTDAEVGVTIAAGSLTASYDGGFAGVNPALAFADPRIDALLNGTASASITVRDLLTQTTSLAAYDIEGTGSLVTSMVRGVQFDKAEAAARLSNQTLQIERLAVSGPMLDGHGEGTIELDGTRSSRFAYEVTRGDIGMAASMSGRQATGRLTTKGQLTGPLDRLQFVGAGTLSQLAVGSANLLGAEVSYDASIPTAEPARAHATLSSTFNNLTVLGRPVAEGSAESTYDNSRVGFSLRLAQTGGVNGRASGDLLLHAQERMLDVNQLAVVLQGLSWRLNSGTTAHIGWEDDGSLSVDRLALADLDTGRQRIEVSGNWRTQGRSALRLQAASVNVDSLAGAFSQPPRYGGMLDADATFHGFDAGGAPIVNGTVTIGAGRVRRLSFEKLTARVDYKAGLYDVDARLDQAPGVWMTAVGEVPLGLLDRTRKEEPIHLSVASSDIDFSIIEGVTDVVHEVSGQLRVNVSAIGTTGDPHFDGTVNLNNAAFAVRSTGSRYKNGRLAVHFTSDRVAFDTLHIEDRRGRALDVKGSLGTHELRVGELEIDATAKNFEVVRNEFGNAEIDARLSFRGRFESPRVTGTIGISGGTLNVDEILQRTLLHPYATEATPLVAAEVDAIAALNPWQRLGLYIEVKTPGTLHLVGENVQVKPGTPLGLGAVNIRAFGDLYLYKDPGQGQALFVTGAFDSLTGTYSFQGRRFDLDPTSSIVFRGDLNPELYVTVKRTISAVETRVTIAGPLNEPELRMASTPPLDQSDILSLIVFNTSLNQLSASQQQELAVRAGTLAAGFLATPIISALERSLGLDILEIEPAGQYGTGPKVTIGDEIAPGLVARFSRQFGQDEYNEATIEYYLSRLLRIRATFSDADVLRSQFIRVERAGIDLLLFFSF